MKIPFDQRDPSLGLQSGVMYVKYVAFRQAFFTVFLLLIKIFSAFLSNTAGNLLLLFCHTKIVQYDLLFYSVAASLYYFGSIGDQTTPQMVLPALTNPTCDQRQNEPDLLGG